MYKKWPSNKKNCKLKQLFFLIYKVSKVKQKVAFNDDLNLLKQPFLTSWWRYN